ncbi:ATP-binding protein [Schinkia sp. CFF1]
MNIYDGKRRLQVKTVDDIFLAMAITDRIARVSGFLHNERIFLRLVTEESCMNAFEYCQNTNQSGFLIGWDKSQGDSLTIFIKHKGKKYNITPRTNEANRGLHGRGLLLIVNLMDKVFIEENGEYVTLLMRKYGSHILNERGQVSYDSNY